MAKSGLKFGEDVQVTLTVLYALGAVASVWMTLFSPYLLEWMGVKFGKKRIDKQARDWPKVFLVLLVLQPVTFVASAVGLWWLSPVAYLPPVHVVCTIVALFAIDFCREEEPWEKGYRPF